MSERCNLLWPFYGHVVMKVFSFTNSPAGLMASLFRARISSMQVKLNMTVILCFKAVSSIFASVHIYENQVNVAPLD